MEWKARMVKTWPKVDVRQHMCYLVCGGRDTPDSAYPDVKLILSRIIRPGDMVIQGGAKGIDHFAKTYAGTRVDEGVACITFAANWTKDGAAAGPIRNKRMLDQGKPDLVIVFPGGKGTANMIRQAKKAKVPILYAWEPPRRGGDVEREPPE